MLYLKYILFQQLLIFILNLNLPDPLINTNNKSPNIKIISLKSKTYSPFKINFSLEILKKENINRKQFIRIKRQILNSKIILSQLLKTNEKYLIKTNLINLGQICNYQKLKGFNFNVTSTDIFIIPLIENNIYSNEKTNFTICLYKNKRPILAYLKISPKIFLLNDLLILENLIHGIFHIFCFNYFLISNSRKLNFGMFGNQELRKVYMKYNGFYTEFIYFLLRKIYILIIYRNTTSLDKSFFE